MTPITLFKLFIAGLCGSLAHFALMRLKSTAGLLPEFHPYEDLQRMLSQFIGTEVHPLVPWAISFFNGSIVLGFLFRGLHPYLPGASGAAKGTVFGVLGWVLMGLVFFPALGEGLFATGVGLGIAPALFSLAMLLVYSVTLGMAYSVLLPSNR